VGLLFFTHKLRSEHHPRFGANESCERREFLWYTLSMKILFVCKGNMCRSQMAEVFYNSLVKDGSLAESAGTLPGIPTEPEGWQLDQIPYLGSTLSVMKEMNFDISKNKTRRVTPLMVQNADIIISMAERETIPDFLLNSPKMIYWEVPNPDGTLESVMLARDIVWKKVSELVATNA